MNDLRKKDAHSKKYNQNNSKIQNKTDNINCSENFDKEDNISQNKCDNKNKSCNEYGYNKNDDSKYYYIVMVIGLILTSLWVVLVKTKPFSDFQYYNNLASEIANGGSIGDTYTSVGYAIFLSFFYRLFGSNIIVGQIANIILYLLSMICFKKILFKINFKGKFERKIIFTVFALFPSSIFYNSILATEILFAMLLLWIVCLFLNEYKHKYIIIGILTGVETIIKPFFIVFFFGVFLVELIYTRKLFYAIKVSLITLLMSCIVIAPMVCRDSKYNGQLTYVSNNGGIVLYINNNSQNKLGRWMPAQDVENSIVKTEEYKNATMTQKNKMLSSAAKKWIKSNPKEFIILGFKRLKNTYLIADDIGYSTYGSSLSDSCKSKLFVLYKNIRQIVFILGLLAIVIYSFKILFNKFNIRKCNKSKFELLIAVLFYMFTCVYFVTEGQTRYSFPLVFIFVYAFVEIVYPMLEIVKDFLHFSR